MRKLLFLTIIVLFTSCTDDKLTNQQAMEVVSSVTTRGCYKRIIKATYSNRKSYDKILKSMKLAEQNGYVNLETEYSTGAVKNLYTTTIRPTSKANDEYLLRKDIYKVAEIEIISIDGISENKEAKTATVRYSYKFVPTPLYVLRIDNIDTCPQDVVKTKEVELIKFDTGWEIKK